MAEKKYEKLHKERIEIINSGKADFTTPNSFQMKSFEEIVEMQLGCNKCFTLFDLQLQRFVKWHLVKEIFGYSNEEFTIGAVNNMGETHIIHDEDIEHKLRYDDIIYQLIGSEKKFGIRMDSYCLNLRMRHKDKSILPVRRRSFIFEAEKHKPLSQLDEWELNNRYKVNHVFPELIISNHKIKERITEEFYLNNLKSVIERYQAKHEIDNKALRVRFNKDALRVLHYKIKGESNESIAKKINIGKQAVANAHSRNFKRLRKLFSLEIEAIDSVNAEKVKRENINVFREICRKYGFYPVPDTILLVDGKVKKG